MKQVVLFTLVSSLILSGCGADRSTTSSTIIKESHSTTNTIEQVITKAAGEIATIGKDGRVIRLAIVPVVPTQQTYATSNEFGNFFSERITAAVQKSSDRVRLFERGRLDAILKEQELSASDILTTDGVERLGQLMPIDYILTGTYTVLDRTVSVQIRVIDVVSGEIVKSGNYSLAIANDLNHFFAIASAPTPATKADRSDEKSNHCSQSDSRIEELLKDLSTEAKIGTVVSTTVGIPFDSECGEIHFTILSTFKRLKITNADYDRFLLKTLKEISSPGDHDNARAILYYWNQRGTILTDAQFDAAFALTLNVEPSRLATWFNLLLKDTLTNESQRLIQQQRIDRIILAIQSGKMGKPKPATMETGVFALISSFKPLSKTTDPEPILYILKKCDPLLKSYEKKGVSPIFGTLMTLYKNRPSEPIAKALIQNCASDFNRQTLTFQDWYDIKESINFLSDSSAYRDHAKYFMNAIRPNFVKLVDQFESGTPRIEATQICVKYGITEAKITPSIDSLLVRLESNNMRIQTEAAKLCKSLGTSAKVAEPKIVKILDRSRVTDESETDDLQIALLGYLGEIKTANVRGRELVVEMMMSINSTEVRDFASTVAAKIGTPMIPLLKQRYQSSSAQWQHVIIMKAVALMGKSAKAELPWLKQKISLAKGDVLRFAIEDAIEAVN